MESSTIWSYLCCDAYPESWQADAVECDACHDPETKIESDQFWVHAEPEVDDCCAHCGATIVTADEEEEP